MTATTPTSPPHEWLHHLQDEADAAFLYRNLAQAEPDQDKSRIYSQLADVEDRHVGVWRRLLDEAGHPAAAPVPSTRARLMAWFGTRFGTRFLLPLLLEEEGREVKSYLD